MTSLVALFFALHQSGIVPIRRHRRVAARPERPLSSVLLLIKSVIKSKNMGEGDP